MQCHRLFQSDTVATPTEHHATETKRIDQSVDPELSELLTHFGLEYNH